MTQTIEMQCEAAMRRIKKHINAAAGQHKRAIKAAHNNAMFDLCWTREKVNADAVRRQAIKGEKA